VIRRLFQGCLLRPRDLKPSQDDLEVIGAFNPGAIAVSGGVVLLVRVAEVFRERKECYQALPRWDLSDGCIVADWVREEDLTFVDPRVVILRSTGLRRLTFTSHLRITRSSDGRRIDSVEPGIFRPLDQTEEYGVEDPRITRLEGRFYFTYVAVSRHGAATALASTEDFKSFTRHGIIFPPENKDVVLFPEKIGGQYWALHRPNPSQHFSAPEIWTASSPDLIHWGNHWPLLGSSEEWDSDRVGAGTPPLRTEEGWLGIYHGAGRRSSSGVGIYSAGAFFLDLENPRQILAARGPILSPENDYEREGFVGEVIFPTGVVRQNEKLLLYCGAADSATTVVEIELQDVLDTLRASKTLMDWPLEPRLRHSPHIGL
jgi:predicted GH43/DUF377 family glycosyl hydrolase